MESEVIFAMEAADFHSRAGECSTEHLGSVKDELMSAEGSLEVNAPEDEEEEVEEEEEVPASAPESEARRQQLLREFDAMHDEAQQLRIMNLLLQCRVRRFLYQRTKLKGALSSAFFKAAHTSPSVGDTAGTPEALENELLQAGEVRRQLDAEAHGGPVEEDLRVRLVAARRQVADRAAQLQQLQEQLLAKLRAPPARRQEAEKMLKRVWPQLLRLRKERLLHSHAQHSLENAQQEVAGLEVFGPQRPVAAYEEMLTDNMKLEERAHERSEQLAALRSAAEQDLQEAAHLREALQSAQHAIQEAGRREVHANAALRSARQEMGKQRQQRIDLFRQKNKVKREMEMLAYPKLLRDHQDPIEEQGSKVMEHEVRQRMKVAQAELEKLRNTYLIQERRIATVRKMMHQRQEDLRDVLSTPSSQEFHMDSKRDTSSFEEFRMDSKCGTSSFQEFRMDSKCSTSSFQEFRLDSKCSTSSFQEFRLDSKGGTPSFQEFRMDPKRGAKRVH